MGVKNGKSIIKCGQKSLTDIPHPGPLTLKCQKKNCIVLFKKFYINILENYFHPQECYIIIIMINEWQAIRI